MGKEDKKGQIQFKVPDEERQKATDQIMAEYAPKNTSLILGENEARVTKVAVFPKEHLDRLLQVCHGIGSNFEGYGNPNVAHSRMAHIIVGDQISGGVQMALYHMLELKRQRGSWPKGVEEVFDKWEEHLGEHYDTSEIGAIVEVGSKKVVLGFETFGRNYKPYEKANWDFFIVTRSTAVALNSISNAIDGGKPDMVIGTEQGDMPMRVAEYQEGQVLRSEGCYQFPFRVDKQLLFLAEERVVRAWNDLTEEVDLSKPGNLTFYAAYPNEKNFLLPVKNPVNFTRLVKITHSS